MTRKLFIYEDSLQEKHKAPMFYCRQKSNQITVTMLNENDFVYSDYKSNSWPLNKTVTIQRNKKKVKTTDESPTQRQLLPCFRNIHIYNSRNFIIY